MPKTLTAWITINSGRQKSEFQITRRNINNLRYGDDTDLIAESEEELKSLLMKVKEESGKVDLKLNILKMKTMTPGPCQGPARADPGSSKWGRCRRGSGYNSFN